MELFFQKYSACGNDFIVIDCLKKKLHLSRAQIIDLCNRHEGIGADGVILVEHSSCATCKMRIFNADGSEAEMCGNGIRSVAHFMHQKNPSIKKFLIESMNSLHEATCENTSISIQMSPPTHVEWAHLLPLDTSTISLTVMNTGVPHAIFFTEDINKFNLKELGPKVRYHQDFQPTGINFSVASIHNKELFLRTYERGVEAETKACGTGATAAALAAIPHNIPSPIHVNFPSGHRLTIHYQFSNDRIYEVIMEGTAKKTFEGKTTILTNKEDDFLEDKDRSKAEPLSVAIL